MAKEAPKFEFEDVQPTSRTGLGFDSVSVTGTGLAFSAKARPRYQNVASVGIKVSKDGRAIQLSRPGAFRLSTYTETDGSVRLAINSAAIPQKAARGRYIHQGNELYVREDV